MAPSTTTIATVTAVTLVTSAVAYAAWFDYKRRSDPAFRKRLRKEKKRVERSKPAAPVGFSLSPEEIKAALQVIRAETLPTTAEEREQYFMDNVAMGEGLCARGPAFELPAALSFYRAMRVYPSPVELIMIYQKTVPDPVFKIVMEMTSLDVSTTAAKSDTGIDEDTPAAPSESQSSSKVAAAGSGDESESGNGDELSAPPSEASVSSLDWDKMTDTGSASQSSQRPVFGPPPP